MGSLTQVTPIMVGMRPDPTFPLLGEPLALDLVNTRVRQGGAELEMLPNPVSLEAWLTAQAERVTWVEECTDDDVAAFRALRDAITLLVEALETGVEPTGAVDTLNAALRDYRGPELTWVDGVFEISSPDRSTRLAGVLHVIAADAVRLVAGPSAKMLRTCAHPQCSIRFVATNPRRQWCSTASCGNRARVARSYTRRART